MPFTKSKWTPFAGMKIHGRVHRVVLRGEVAYVEGQVLVNPGYGQDIREQQRNMKVQSILHPPSIEVTSRPNSALERLISPVPGEQLLNGDVNEYLHNTKSSVHFDSEIEARELAKLRPISPLVSGVGLRTADVNIHSTYGHIHTTHGLAGRHILTADMFTKEQLNDIFNTAQTLRVCVMKERQLDHILKGKIMASIFYEVSTRTSCSFTAAMLRLGGGVISMDGTTSSVKKGETLDDSVKIMSGLSNIVVLRHSEPGAVTKAAQLCRKPLINAGDGVGEHPTQALLDIFTIREEIGTVNGLNITMVGDLKNGRTVHSLARLLTLYNVNLRYVSPKGLEMPDHVRHYVAQKGICQKDYDRLEDVLGDTDVLYMTRIQRERFTSQDEYERVCGQFVVTPKLMTGAKRKMVVMHPLPRNLEISPDFDSDPRAAYFRQAESGVYVRMALLAMVLGRC